MGCDAEKKKNLRIKYEISNLITTAQFAYEKLG